MAKSKLTLQHPLHVNLAGSLKQQIDRLTLTIAKEFDCTKTMARKLLAGSLRGCHAEQAIMDSTRWTVNGADTPRTHIAGEKLSQQ